MTTRGKPPSSFRPTTPPDPTLTTRPVPRTRTFTVQSFGPGSASSIKSVIRTPEQVRAESDPATYLNPLDAQYSHILQDPIYQLIQEVHADSEVVPGELEPHEHEPDPTWGFYAFVVDYDAETLAKIPSALANLVEVTRWRIRASSTAQYTDEALRRFKIDVVQHEEALSCASDDRVREEFRAFLRGLNLLDDCAVGSMTVLGASMRNYACLVLNRPTICLLADLAFPRELRGDYRIFRKNTIKLVDAWWQRQTANVSAYRGIDFIPINSLANYYGELLSSANGGAMEDLWPFAKQGP
ncbi:hypothetical protein BDW74DRAFT_180861 [Aspergillus multicolor]|uniref:uncharacterized protein n=1 Tax=Aspergillus multicolor TaxID=41759 RepID=UPI003CCDAE26